MSVFQRMETHTSDEPRNPTRTVLGWLGLGNQDRHEVDPASNGDARKRSTTTAREGLVRQARRELLSDISGLLIDNDLEITPHNLNIAHSAFAGLNPSLKRQIQLQSEAGLPINQEWLNQASASDQQMEEEAVEKLIGELEQGIDDFSRSTKSARDATSEYSDALEHHVGQLEASADPAELLCDLADYARTMLERSRKAEAQLLKSENESATLRRNLDRARHDAEIDFLTGLPNRRAFEAVLKTQVEEAQKANDTLCIALCDIDLFKNVNDTHGHEAGDRIICMVGNTLNKISGSNCHIARHGGEEFVMLFRGEKLMEAMHRLDEAREQMASRKLVNRKTEQPFGQISFSAGVADVFAYDGANTALAAADEALYQAKENGRNQIKLAVRPEQSGLSDRA